MSSPRQMSMFERESKIQADFERFHAAYPYVMDELVRRGRMVMGRGWKKYSIKTLCEVVRWHVHYERGPDQEFKLNNNHTSRYARLIMEQFPEFRGFFELRELRS